MASPKASKKVVGEIKIYGASDDLMEFGGDFSDEGNPSNDEKNFIFLNDGSIIGCNYDDAGVWRLDPFRLGEGTTVKEHVKGSEEEDTVDELTLNCSKVKFEWFEIWRNSNGPTEKELREAIVNAMDNDLLDDVELSGLKMIYAVLKDRE